jgi:hypothetical protein
MTKELIFTIRKFPDIDNFSPIIDHLAKKKNKILIFSVNLTQDLSKDYRISYLLKTYNCVSFVNFYDFFNLNFFQKLILDLEYSNLKNTHTLLNFIYKILKKLGLFLFLRNFFFTKKNLKFKNNLPKNLIIDHLTPKKLFYFNLFFDHLRKKKTKIISIPAGLPLYTKHPKPWDKAKIEISNLSYQVDKIVLQHKYWAKEINEFKKLNNNYEIIGSPRYTNDWRKILNKLVKKKSYTSHKNKIKIVYMDSNNPSHIDYQKLKQNTLNFLSQNKFYDVKFKPHPRSNKIYVKLSDDIKICQNEDSLNLIKWADIVLGDISAIMLEVILQNKRYISLSYLRKKNNNMLYDKYKICEECKNFNYLEKMLKTKSNFYNTKSYKKNLEKFMNDFIYFPNKNILIVYENLIMK